MTDDNQCDSEHGRRWKEQYLEWTLSIEKKEKNESPYNVVIREVTIIQRRKLRKQCWLKRKHLYDIDN